MASQIVEQSWARNTSERGTGTQHGRAARVQLSVTQAEDQKGLSYLEPELVLELRGRLRAQTPECVMATFGISMNTWIKLRDGKPIRTSVAQRLIERLKHAL